MDQMPEMEFLGMALKGFKRKIEFLPNFVDDFPKILSSFSMTDLKNYEISIYY